MDSARIYMDGNRRLWQSWTAIHEHSAFYDVDGFKEGRDTLNARDAEGLGDVDGRTLLHLQCHFGLDTMSLARRGARVTGLDFSPRAIELARSLSEETGIDARFICANVYDAADVLAGETFDIVYTAAGVLSWLPDLAAWGAVIARLLAPGGRFFLREAHPVAMIWKDDPGAAGLEVGYDYVNSPEPLEFPNAGSYADKTAPVSETEYAWNHSMSEIINALAGSGLRIDELQEYEDVGWQQLPVMVIAPDGQWLLPEGYHRLPWTFTLKASRPA